MTLGFRYSVILTFFFLAHLFMDLLLILLKISMNANIVKIQIFHKIRYDLKGHSRSQKMTFLFKT